MISELWSHLNSLMCWSQWNTISKPTQNYDVIHFFFFWVADEQNKSVCSIWFTFFFTFFFSALTENCQILMIQIIRLIGFNTIIIILTIIWMNHSLFTLRECIHYVDSNTRITFKFVCFYFKLNNFLDMIWSLSTETIPFKNV